MDDEKLAARAKELALQNARKRNDDDVDEALLGLADRLLSLREENARLRGALTELVIVFPDPSNFKSDLERARAALAPPQDK